MWILISLETDRAELVRPTGIPFVNGLLYLVGSLGPGAIAGAIYLVAAAGFGGALRFLFTRQQPGDLVMTWFGIVAFTVGAAWSAYLWRRFRLKFRLFRIPAPIFYFGCAGLFVLLRVIRALVHT